MNQMIILKINNYKIFGKKFVEINKDNIELNINEKKNHLINEHKIRKGKNNIKIKIKDKITDFQNLNFICFVIVIMQKIQMD